MEQFLGIYNGYLYRTTEGIIERFSLKIYKNGEAEIKAINYHIKGTVSFLNQNLLITLSGVNGHNAQLIFRVTHEIDGILYGIWSGVSPKGNLFASRLFLEKVISESHPRQIPLDSLEFTDFIQSKLNPEIISKYLTAPEKFQKVPKEVEPQDIQEQLEDIKKSFEEKIEELKRAQEEILIDLNRQRGIANKIESWKIETKQLIAQGKIEKALEEILKVVIDISNEKYNEAILLNARLSQLNIELRIGVVSEETRFTERNKITHSLLGLIDSLSF